jgi:hypothetical protein
MAGRAWAGCMAPRAPPIRRPLAHLLTAWKIDDPIRAVNRSAVKPSASDLDVGPDHAGLVPRCVLTHANGLRKALERELAEISRRRVRIFPLPSKQSGGPIVPMHRRHEIAVLHHSTRSTISIRFQNLYTMCSPAQSTLLYFKL